MQIVTIFILYIRFLSPAPAAPGRTKSIEPLQRAPFQTEQKKVRKVGFADVNDVRFVGARDEVPVEAFRAGGSGYEESRPFGWNQKEDSTLEMKVLSFQKGKKKIDL